ncbi:MAG: cytochrome c [Bacteroidia bacterium]|nr:cytochrome c [Bacteroidia bacterium]
MKKFLVVCSISVFSLFNSGVLKAEDLSLGSSSPVIPQDKNLGIGPVKKLVLGPIDKKMVEEGKALYTAQCIVCHDMDQKKIGPALKNITKMRTPEYLMNVLLNSAQMQKEDPTMKALLKEYNNMPMPDPGYNQAKARAVVEYLRSVAK